MILLKGIRKTCFLTTAHCCGLIWTLITVDGVCREVYRTVRRLSKTVINALDRLKIIRGMSQKQALFQVREHLKSARRQATHVVAELDQCFSGGFAYGVIRAEAALRVVVYRQQQGNGAVVG